MKKTIPIILLFLVCLSYTITAYAEGENNSWDESDASEGPCFTVTYDGPIGMTAPEENNLLAAAQFTNAEAAMVILKGFR